MGVMKRQIIVPRVGLKPTSLAFRASVLTLHHIGSPDVTTIPTPTCLCSSLPQRSVPTTTYICIRCYQSLQQQIFCLVCCCFFVFFCILATSKVISGWMSTCDSAHSWPLYSVAPLGIQAINTMTSVIMTSVTHFILTLSQPAVVLS